MLTRKHSKECKPAPKLTIPCTYWLTVGFMLAAMHYLIQVSGTILQLHENKHLLVTVTALKLC